MRSRLTDNAAENIRFVTAQSEEVGRLTITANFTIPSAPAGMRQVALPVYSFDATSTARTITLPTAPGGSLSLGITIRNASSGAAVLTVNDPTGPTTVLALSQGETGQFFSIGTTWYGGISATGSSVVNPNVPAAQYTTAALQSAVIPAANMSGAEDVMFENTGTTPANLQSDTAANLVAAIPNAQVGYTYRLSIRNSSGSANTATITTNTGITLHGTMTIAQNVTRTFAVVFTSLTAVDIYSMGISAAGV